jgi:hypothetical protein
MRAAATLCLVVSLFHPAAGADELLKGRLCIISGADSVDVSLCTEVSGKRLIVDAAPEPRRFAWIRADGAQLVAGELAREATAIELPGDRTAVRFTPRGQVDRGWPGTLSIEFGEKASDWNLFLPTTLAASLREIHLPHGTYKFRFAAAHHQPLIRSDVPVAGKPIDLGVLTFSPLSRFGATAARKDGTPLSGATLIDDLGELLATADYIGHIEYEARCTGADCSLPARVTIDYPGLAGTRVEITDVKRDFDAGTVVLDSGGTLDLTVKRPDGERFPIEVEIVEATRRPRKLRTIATETLAADSDSVRIERLPAGTSALYLRGAEPAHVFSAYVTIEDAKTLEQTVELMPTDLRIRVLMGESPVSDATVTISVPHGRPDYHVPAGSTDADGRVGVTVWQSGSLVASAKVGEMSEMAFVRLAEERRKDVEIRISQTVIRGRVLDAATGKVMPGITMRYNWRALDDSGNMMRSLQTSADGDFELRGARAGRHTFSVDHPEYLPADTSLETNPADVERMVEIALQRGKEHPVELLWNDGSPIRHARLIEVISQHARYQYWQSDETGRVTLPMSSGSRKHVWVVPREGSFAFITIDSNRESSRATLPRPHGVIRVHAFDEEGRLAPSSHLMFRYDGRLIDGSVMGTITALQGARFRTGADGTATLVGFPPGAYEVWATQYDGDDLGVSPPHKQKVTPFVHSGGDQTVTVEAWKFERRR